MTEHKFTDEEIKKALECCGSNHHTDEKYACKNCPLNGRSFDEGSCYDEVLHDLALSLINRYEAEIERLTVNMNAFGLGMKREAERADTARSETTKEFAERLKEAPIKCSYPLFGLSTKDEITEHFNDIMMQVRDAIDTIAKEMTEGQK